MREHIKLHHLQKTYGGRMSHRQVVTFITACNAKKIDVHTGDVHAYWSIHRTIQPGNKSVDSFSVVGLAELEGTPVIVKLVLNEMKGVQEVKVAQHFRERPHVNIVNTFCEFTCRDNDFRWKKDVIRPKCLCLSKGFDDQEFTVLVQEYVKEGDVNGLTWTTKTWLSTLSQLTCAVIEWYEQGFVYLDMHYGNILLKKARTKTHTYNAFDRSWTVQLNGVRPIVTDFSNSKFVKTIHEYTTLATQIAEIWYIFKDDGPTKCRDLLHRGYFHMSRLIELKDVLDYIDKIFEKLTVLCNS